MAACCGVPRCSCSVIAGPGVTVDGNGSAAAPYIITVDSTPTPVQAGDTETIDTTISGTGVDGDPYIVSADVILDPAPPGGGTNLLEAGPDGLYVECADVRTCFSAGDGVAYDEATGVIGAQLSTDAGNTTVFGGDGGIYTPAATTGIQAADTPSVDVTVTGTGAAGDPYEVTADVILDPAPPGGGTNLLEVGPDGLYVECADVRTCITAGDGITYDPGTGEIAAVPAGVEEADSPTVDVTVTGTGGPGDPYQVGASVILDPTPPGGGTNLLEAGPDGLYVECADVRTCFTAGDGIAYDPGTGEIAAQLSTDAGNTVVFGTDGGLYAPPGASGTVVEGGDTPTASNTVTGTGAVGDPYIVSTDVVLDPAPPGGGANLLESGPDGLYVECADVRTCFTAGDGIDYDPGTGEIAAQLSTDAGNTTVFGTDGGLYTPAGSTAVTAVDSTSVDVEVTGTGTAGDPYEVTADVILDPAPPGGGTNLLEVGPDGLYVECADVRTCITAGDGAAYTPGTGEVEARLSTDANNAVVFGGDGGLYVPEPALPLVGCGLAGDGTAGDPLVVVPAAGSEAWPWPCDVAVESTLKCDPDTGELWTPPDHFSAMDQIYVEHFLGGFLTPIGPTGGWAIVDPGANQQFVIPANFLGNNCRTWAYEITNSGTWDIEHNAAAVFELGLVVQVNGGPLQVRPLWGHLTAVGQAHRERGNGTANESAWNIPAGTGASVVMFPAVNVTAGQITAIHSWISDAMIDTQTNTP